MKKLLTAVFGAVVVSAVAVTSAFAAYDFGQLGSGDIYRVRNVSDNQTSFVKTANADLCETVQFKVRVHNAGPKTLTNVNVKATLSSGVKTMHTSTVAVTASNNRENAVATGSAGVNLSKAGSISYVNGSTELLDTNGNKISTLGDTILTSGVTIGDVAVSLNNMRFVQFKAKTNCPEEPKNITVCELATKKIVTIREDQFNASKYSKNLDDCAAKPGEITVCELATKTIVTIKENDFDDSKHTRDLTKCETIPTELPKTGASGLIAVVAALLTAGVAYAAGARKNVLG